MAAPNIVNMSILYGKTSLLALTTSPLTAITVNPSTLVKVQSITVANTHATLSVDVTVDIYRSSTAYRIAGAITIPAKSTLVVASRDGAVWLEENDALRLTASANSCLESVISYDVMT